MISHIKIEIEHESALPELTDIVALRVYQAIKEQMNQNLVDVTATLEES